MGRTNPYGVGDSGQQAYDRKMVCPCCGLPYIERAGPKTPLIVKPCVDCRGHDAEGSLKQRLEAAESHARRSLDHARRAHVALAGGMRERDAERRESDRLKRDLHRVIGDLNYYRAQVRAAWLLHGGDAGTCECGEKPCRTRAEAHRIEEEMGGGPADRHAPRIPRLL